MPLTAGEVCTTNYAKFNNNIYRLTKPFKYTISPEYSDMKTYNLEKDDIDNRDKYVCIERESTKRLKTTDVEYIQRKQDLIKNYTSNVLPQELASSNIKLTGNSLSNLINSKIKTYADNLHVDSEIPITIANKLCIIEAGPGFIRKPSSDANNASCVTYDCPTDWERKENNICVKPKEDAVIDKRSHCDERWYDWFSIPNYHLGNGYYEEKKGVCRSPCNKYSIPNYATDPVDGARFDFSSSDKLDTCVDRDKYFMGKYQDGSDYCPLAWIHRMHYTIPENVEKKMDNILTQYAKDYGSSNLTKAFIDFKKPTNKRQIGQNIAVQMKSDGFEPLPSLNQNMQQACNSLNTKDRVAEAYNICKKVKNNTYENKDENTILQLKQACNAVFCNENDTALTTINKTTPICFDIPSTIKYKDPDDVKDPTTFTADKEQSFMFSSFATAVNIVIFVISGIFVYYFWTRIFWPKFLRKVWRYLMVNLFKATSNEWYEKYDTFVACKEADDGGIFNLPPFKDNKDKWRNTCKNEGFDKIKKELDAFNAATKASKINTES